MSDGGGESTLTLSRAIGRVLRRARESRGLTLRQASNLSHGRFPPTSLASYERGERAISVERFYRLARVYGIAPERLMAQIARSAEQRPAAVLDLTRLDELAGVEANVVSGFVREVARLRTEAPRETVALRLGDLEVLASASGRRASEMLEAIRPALAAEGAPS